MNLQETREDLTLFNTGLAALVNTFSIVLEDSDTGRQALDAVNNALCVINNLLTAPDTSERINNIMTTPPAPAPAVELAPAPEAFADAIKPAYVTALEALTYSVTEEFNGDAMHIIEAHLRATPAELTLDQLVMTLNMCRILKNGKESRLTVDQRTEIAILHTDFTASQSTRKAQREVLSEIEKRLEYEHGKYASKAELVKAKFDTAVSYSGEWLERITNFADNAIVTVPEYLIDPLPVHYQDTQIKGGEVEAYIDTHTNERLGVDAKGRVWRTPVNKTSRSALDLFMGK